MTAIDPTTLDDAQSIFNELVQYIASMTHQAISNDGLCMYRSAYGPCPVGHLLTDDEYAAPGECKFIQYDRVRYNLDDMSNPSFVCLPKIFVPERLLPFLDLLDRFQEVHDDKENWAVKGPNARMVRNLMTIALDHDLDTVIVKKVWPSIDGRHATDA